MKNVLIIQGGGRPNGNTAQLVAAFEKGVVEAGHSAEVISLQKNIVNGRPKISKTSHLQEAYEFVGR